MTTKRKGLGAKIRFEVFKRDSFKCQYCGASAPEAILEVDHIHPISKGGSDEMVNYITACKPCNAGKRDRTLDDNAIVQRQKAQLDELNERREQLEMMLNWRNGLADIRKAEVDAICQSWQTHVPGWELNDAGRRTAEKMIRQHGLQTVLDAIESASSVYIKLDEHGLATNESADRAWDKLGGFLRMANTPENERRLYYIKGILRNRISYVPYNVISILKDALQKGVTVEEMEDEAKSTSSWTRYRQWMKLAEENV
jgi:hypothetical protein